MTLEPGFNTSGEASEMAPVSDVARVLISMVDDFKKRATSGPKIDEPETKDVKLGLTPADSPKAKDEASAVMAKAVEQSAASASKSIDDVEKDCPAKKCSSVDMKARQKAVILKLLKASGVLSARQKKQISAKNFAIPPRGKSEKAESGHYPIPDISHARNALARVSQFGSSGDQTKVRSKVHTKFPSLGKKSELVTNLLRLAAQRFAAE